MLKLYLIEKAMQIQEIKDKLRKKAVFFHTGDAGAEHPINQSWIGRVNLGYADEGCPLDVNQKPMSPLMQLCLIDLPFIPNALRSTKLLTIFISPEFLQREEKNFCIREYSSLEGLVEKDFGVSFKGIKSCPLFPQLIENSFPQLDTYDISNDLLDLIFRKEREEGIEYYDDIYERNKVQHQLGGYPHYCQGGGGDFKAGYEFVLQVASDLKAELDIVDDGNMYFAKNPANNQWQAYVDFY